MVRVIFTGQSGLNKQPLLNDLKALAQKKGRQVLLFSVGDMMYQAKPGLQPGRLLKLPLDQIEALRERAFHVIKDRINANPNADVFVDTHATFRWETVPIKGFHPKEITQLKPDICITFVADVNEVKFGLRRADFPLHLTLREIMTWREEELLCSELLADLVKKCGHYIVPRTYGPQRLFKLVYDQNALRCYLSFPISDKVTGPMMQSIDKFRAEFFALDNLVIFDPLEITEEPKLVYKLKYKLGKDPAAKTMKTPVADGEITLSIEELREIQPYVEGHTRALDLILVSQSNAIMAYAPKSRGRPFLASGVTTEINYASSKGNFTYLIWPSETPPTLMLAPDEMFMTVEDAVEFMKKK